MSVLGNDLSKGIIYTWKIKNISCFQGKEFCSPELKGFQNAKWQLKLHITEKTSGPYGMYPIVTCIISRLKDMEDLEEYIITSDMTFFSGKRSWIGLNAKTRHFKVGYGRCGSVLASHLVHDLTIRCRLWKGKTCPDMFSHCNAVTEFDAHYSILESSIKQSTNGNLFLSQSRTHEESENNSIAIRSRLSKTLLIFQVTLNNDNISKICTGHIYLKEDKEGSLLWLKESTKPAAYKKGQLWTIPLIFNWNDFVSKKKYHCLNDEIMIRFELVSSSGQVIYSASNLPLDGSEDFQITMRKGKVLNFSVLSMLQNDILCDMQLKTATRTFPAHKVVLGANSTVFQTMFISNKKEKANDIVEIFDIEDHVIERLLYYAYSGDVGELTWDFAFKLYYAANKYEMSLLKNECSNFLSHNLSFINICEALVFSNKRNDKYLQQSVHKFTCNTADSKGWKDFINEETMRVLNFLSQILNLEQGLL